MQSTSILSILMAAVALTACGGGGDSTPAGVAGVAAVAAVADVASKYVGTWVGPCENNGNNTSTKETIVLTKTSNTTVSNAATDTNYSASATCTGANTTANSSQVLTFAGTKLVGADTVDLVNTVNVPPGTSSGKNILLVNGATIRVGDQSGAKDAAGYPTVLLPASTLVFTKQ